MEALKQIPCKYFAQGDAKCPFGNGCDYAHILRGGQRFIYPQSKENMRVKFDQNKQLSYEIMRLMDQIR